MTWGLPLIVILQSTNAYVQRYQNQRPDSALSQGLIGIAWLMLGIGVLVAAVWCLRTLLNRSETQSEQFDFSLADLRELHRSGQLSEAEFEAAKQRLLAHATQPPLDPTSDTDADKDAGSEPPSR